MDIETLFSLKGKVAVVTGGSRGLGKHFAQAFIQAGCDRVYITARKAQACVDTAEELGPKCIPLPHDLATLDGIEAFVAELSGKEDHVDILVNNAGAAWGEDYLDYSEAGWDKTMNINLKSPFFLTQKMHGLLTRKATPDDPSKVINIASIDGLRLNPWETYAYHASKSGLIYLTRRVAARLLQDNVLVNCIAPGAFASDMNRAARDHADEVAKRIPTGRVGNPEDISAAAIYLAARSGNYVVGQTIAVDGGLVWATIGTSIDA